jgi:general secretion pathway protein B
MSFILDALKKSESERKRQGAPGIASIPESGQQQGKARWPWLVAGLLTINLIVLAAIMLQNNEAPVQSAATPDVAPTADTAAESFSEIVREAKRTTPQTATNTASNRTAPPEPEPAAAVPVFTPDPVPTESVSDGLPTFNDLRVNGQLQLPDMHLDIHVYSDQPADRFVFVNMSKYKESATLNEGPRVNEIVPDGVVLDYMGMRFLLPRE